MNWAGLTFLLLGLVSQDAESKIIGTFVMPHGIVIVNPNKFSDTQARDSAWKLHNATKHVGEIVSGLEPDLIFITTPHGRHRSGPSKFKFYVCDYGEPDNMVKLNRKGKYSVFHLFSP